MLYTVNEGVFFAELPNRTQNNETKWGIIFNSTECDLAIGAAHLMLDDNKADAEQIEQALLDLQHHIKLHLDKYDRMNEVFNLQMSADDRNRVIRADPRRARTFLAPHKNALLPEITMKVSTVDKDFSHVENLLNGEGDIFADANLYLLNIKTVSPLICYYVSGVLVTLDRLRLLQEDIRRERETT